MKDFSLFYGPVRAWLPVVAMAVLAMVIFVNQSGGDAECDRAAAECAEPLVGERQLLGNGEGLDVAPAGLPMETEDEADEPSPWDDFDPSTSEVPFVSLKPSPEPMTEAGQDLARTSPAAEVDVNQDSNADERP